jgi:phosphoesterase RecJ-like protein
MILKEMPDGQIKGSLRTTKNHIDVSALAKQLGGGGHKKAAGFSLPGTISEVLNKILTPTA